MTDGTVNYLALCSRRCSSPSWSERRPSEIAAPSYTVILFRYSSGGDHLKSLFACLSSNVLQFFESAAYWLGIGPLCSLYDQHRVFLEPVFAPLNWIHRFVLYGIPVRVNERETYIQCATPSFPLSSSFLFSLTCT